MLSSSRISRAYAVSRRFATLALFCAITTCWQTTSAQIPSASPAIPLQQAAVDRNESERTDKLTGGHIEVAEFAAGQPDIRLTLNLPSFRLTLWQNGKEVKSYYVGVGLKEHPLYIGDREASGSSGIQPGYHRRAVGYWR